MSVAFGWGSISLQLTPKYCYHTRSLFAIDSDFVLILFILSDSYSISHLKRCSSVLEFIYLRQLESFSRPATAGGEGTAQGSLNPPPPVPCIPGFHPFLLHFLPLALFQLQNIMQHCCIFSSYFSHFTPFWNSHLLPLLSWVPSPCPPPHDNTPT